MINISKIPLDKYYTPKDLAKYVVDKTKQIIGEDNITEYIEPSAGGGVFLDFLDKPYKAYDIEPEDNRIIKQDYLNLDLPYKKGRCIIGIMFSIMKYSIYSISHRSLSTYKYVV